MLIAKYDSLKRTLGLTPEGETDFWPTDIMHDIMVGLGFANFLT